MALWEWAIVAVSIVIVIGEFFYIYYGGKR
jgi:hypothetical protein